MKKNRFWLVIFILIAWGLRLILLGEQSLWYDEGVTWMLSQMQLPDLINWTAADIQPPLYYLLIWTTDIIIDDSEWALRFPSVIFNVLTIPLVYALARHLFSTSLQRSVTALLATALFTLSPLMIYYSQEARMYTLLTFEAALASYLLLKILYLKDDIAISHRRYIAYSLLYVLTATAALYTHYFAAFLLVAHALYALYILWQQHFSNRLLIQLLISFGGALLLFAPWLPTLFARLGDDPSYWPGALKLNEVLRKLLLTFTMGETVIEQTGWWLSLGFLVIFLIYPLWIILNKKTGNNTSIHNSPPSAIQNSPFFLLLWLLLPILLILALTYQSPKFNPRYTLLAWPAFALILAGTLTGLLHTNNPKHETRNTKHVSNALFFISTIFILTTTAFSLVNWFTDPRFSKDDFKALAQFVREREASDETVLLSSGHLFPVWAYYYGWDNWTPLPWMLRLDVNQVTNLEIAADIADAIEGQEGVWLVTWQDEVIDPNGVVPFWLDLIGQHPDDAGDFWGVGLEHWRLDPDKIGLLEENPIQRPVDFGDADEQNSSSFAADQTALASYNFAHQIDLLGYTQLSDTDLVVFWRARQPLPDNLILTLDLTDSEGFSWSRETIIERLGAPSYPPSRWPVGETMITHHQLQWQIGTPPGLYMAEVGIGTTSGQTQTNGLSNNSGEFVAWDILDEQGKPQRRTALLDFVNLSQLVEPADGPLPIDQDPLVDLFPIIGLRRSILPQETAQPGDRLLLALLWQAGEYNLDNVSITFDLVDAAGQTHLVGSSFTPSRNFNLPRWDIGDTVLGQYWLDIPPETVPGPASLQVHIINVTAFPYDEVFPFDEIEILPAERNFSPPDSTDIPLEADFSGQVTLIGLDCPANCSAAPGESITLTLYWRADAPLDINYTVFTHLLDSEETVLINADHAPPKPTQGWVIGEIITDPITLTIPADLSPGNYTIEIGLYDATAPNFQRLPLTTGETRLILPEMLVVE